MRVIGRRLSKNLKRLAKECTATQKEERCIRNRLARESREEDLLALTRMMEERRKERYERRKERAEGMAALRRSGKKLREIGAASGICAERVRQLLKLADV